MRFRCFARLSALSALSADRQATGRRQAGNDFGFVIEIAAPFGLAMTGNRPMAEVVIASILLLDVVS